MSRERLRNRWRREMLATHTITEGVKLLLLVMCDYMNADGYVSVPRSELARILGRHPSKVSDRVKAARRAGWLTIVSGGWRGHTAVYRASVPHRNGYRFQGTFPREFGT